MDFLDEPTFNSAFGKRLEWVRNQMGLSRPQMAKRLHITADQLKRYETRDTAGFPLYLLPPLIEMTFEPYAFWMGDLPSKYWRFRVVKATPADPQRELADHRARVKPYRISEKRED